MPGGYIVLLGIVIYRPDHGSAVTATMSILAGIYMVCAYGGDFTI